MSVHDLTWEQAVQWLREQPEQADLVRACYYDDPLLEAAQRFAASEEWIATLRLLPSKPARALDLGAGRGISSYGLARAGWQVIALEPDPSPLVGSGAIRTLAAQTGLLIDVIEEYGERLPIDADSLDLVYGRQVLHHARDLPQLCHEVARVLKPGGVFVAVREHVISRKDDLPAFLESHALHKFYGGENAFLLSEYRQAILDSGLKIERQLGPLENPVNYFPMTRQEWQQACASPLPRLLGESASNLLLSEDNPFGRSLLALLSHVKTRLSNAPGRLYSFVARKNGP
ncbi:MAG: class I SAM-dependent methyltransferase [Chloroflexi bacterium]|nr:class I SAM-dependent methyltransferase [Chloroflexota bacterium]